MQIFFRYFSFVLVAALMSAMPPHMRAAQAQATATQTPIVLGILDGDMIMRQSNAGKSLQVQVTQAQKVIDADAQKQSETLRAQFGQLEQQRATLQQPDFDAKAAALKAQEDKLRDAFGRRRQGLEVSFNKAKQTLLDAVGKAVAQVQQARGLTLILNKSQNAVVMSAPTWDITQDVMVRVNKILPNVKL